MAHWFLSNFMGSRIRHHQQTRILKDCRLATLSHMSCRITCRVSAWVRISRTLFFPPLQLKLLQGYGSSNCGEQVGAPACTRLQHSHRLWTLMQASSQVDVHPLLLPCTWYGNHVAQHNHTGHFLSLHFMHNSQPRASTMESKYSTWKWAIRT